MSWVVHLQNSLVHLQCGRGMNSSAWHSDLAALSCGLSIACGACLKPSWGSLRADTPPSGLHRRLALPRLHYLLLTTLLIRPQAVYAAWPYHTWRSAWLYGACCRA